MTFVLNTKTRTDFERVCSINSVGVSRCRSVTSCRVKHKLTVRGECKVRRGVTSYETRMCYTIDHPWRVDHSPGADCHDIVQRYGGLTDIE